MSCFFVGLLVPVEYVMQFVGPLPAVTALLEGLFVLPAQQSQTLQTLQTLQTPARETSMFGAGMRAGAPLLHNAIAWAAERIACCTGAFGVGAVPPVRRETMRAWGRKRMHARTELNA